VDGSYEGRLEFSAFRALHRGDGERTVGADEALSGKQGAAGGRKVEATVVEERPSAIYSVVLEGQQKVLAHLGGAVKRNFVRLVPGDRVEVELSPHDPTRGRITRKL
jgi:translation initiation factor IF-1